MKRLLRSVTPIILCLVALVSHAGTITATAAGGSWNATSTWVGGVVPGPTDVVIIPSGSSVQVSESDGTPIGDGNSYFPNSATIQVYGTYTVTSTVSDPVFRNPMTIEVFSGGKMMDNSAYGEMWVAEVFHLYVYSGGDYNNPQYTNFLDDRSYPSAPYNYNLSPTSGTDNPGPFSLNLTSTGFTFSATNPPSVGSAPSVTTGAASSLTWNAAAVTGTVNDNNLSSTVTVIYGTDPTLTTGTAQATPTPATVGAGSGATTVNASLTGLTPNTTYYYEVQATNTAGTTPGAIQQFTTGPVVYTVAYPADNQTYGAGQNLNFYVVWNYGGALSVTGTPYINLQLGNKTVKAMCDGATGSNTLYFTYAVQPGDYAAPGQLTLGNTINLNGGTITASGGATANTDLSAPLYTTPPATNITVSAPAQPIVGTPTVTNITTTGAQLNDFVDDSGATTAVTVRYDTDPAMTTPTPTTVNTTPASIAAGSGNTAVSTTLTGLTSGTLYYYQFMALSSAGTSASTINSFFTTPTVYFISYPGNGTYAAGDILHFYVEWPAQSGLLTVTGTPTIDLTIGHKKVTVTADGADPTTSKVYFIYTVQPGDYASGTLQLGNDIHLNGGQILDQYGGEVDTSLTNPAIPTSPLPTSVVVVAPAPPIASTSTADMITATGATVYGYADDSAASTTVTFTYSTDPTLTTGTTTTAAIIPTIAPGTGNTLDSLIVTGLLPSTTYYYRITAVNSQGTAPGNILSFTTGADVAPTVTTTGGATTFYAIGSGSVPVTVDAGVTTTSNFPTLSSATVTISSGFSAGDVLSFTPASGITGSYSASTLTLTSSPAATVAQWNAVLQSITFVNTSATAAIGNRVINFVVNDGILNSSAAAKTVSVMTGLAFTGGASQTATVCENSGAQDIGSLLAVSDLSSTDHLTFAVVSGPSNGTLGGFPGAFTANGGTLTPTGLTYTPTAGASGTDAYTISVTNGSLTAQIVINVTINAQPAAPTVTGAASVCSGASITLTGNPTGGAWSSDNTGFATVDPASGMVTGVAQGTANIIYTITNGSGCSNSATSPVAVNPIPANPGTITGPASVNNEQTGVAYSVVNDPTVTYTWSYAPPAGVTINGMGNSVTLDFGPTAASGTLSVTAVSNCSISSAASTLPVTVSAPVITLSPTSLTAATVGVAYTASISATGGQTSYTYALATGSSLPAGLTLASDGTLSGTPTAGGPFNFTVTATDADGFTGTQAYTFTVNPAVITLSSPLPAATVGVSYTASITASGGTPSYTYALATGSSLPAGLTLASDGTLSGTPTAGGSFTFTVQATDASTGTGPYTGSQTYTFTVNPATIVVSPSTLSAATVGVSYSASISASGGTSSYTYALATGSSLPAGLTLASDGTLSGTPTAGGSFTFTIQATDASTGSGPYTGSQTYTLTVNPATIVVAPSTLSAATVGVSYSASISASGGTPSYTYALATGSSLPAGLTLASDGTLSGTPTAGGSFTFTIQATDASTGSGPYTGSQTYTLTVNPATIVVAPSTLSSATVGVAYTASITASGGSTPYTYALATGSSLPAGLTLASDGTLSGTPTAGGSFTFTIQATDASTGSGPYTGSQTYTLTVNSATIVVAPATLGAATVGVAYTASITASGGSTPYTYALATGSSLPAGLTLASDGTLSGTPTAGGSFTFTIQATDASTGSGPYTGSQTYTLTVNPAIIVLSPATLPVASVGAPYSQPITASGGTPSYTFALATGSSLPAGLTLASDGTLSGTPTAGGSFTFTIQATDASTGSGPYTGSQTYTLTVSLATIAVSPATLPSATVGVAYSQPVSATGGTSPYTFALATGSSLPAGLTLASDGTISGTPTAGGAFTFTIQATDASTGSGPYTGTQVVTLTVNAATIIVSPATLPAATVGSAYSQPVSATGGTSPYTFALATGSSLPAGLTLASDGTISGTPTAGGTFTFTIQATDASTGTGPYTGTQVVTLTVNAATVVISPSSLPAATVGVAYNQAISATGGTSPYTFALATGSSLPAGLALASDGTLSGTPTAGGTFTFAVTATDASTGSGPYSVTLTYTLTVNPATIVVSPATLPAATVGAAYSQSISASGGAPPYTYALATGSSLPAGLTLASDGTLSGTPTAGGAYTFTVTATDASTGSGPYVGTVTYTFTVNPATIVVAPSSLPAATVGAAYSQSITATGGTPPYTYALATGSSLPAGLTLNSSGTLSGTPTAGGTFTFTITATDASTGSGPYSGSQTYTLVVGTPVISLAPATLPNATIAAAYTASVSASGGTSPYTYALATGSNLPTGLTLASDGTISGTPTSGGSFTFTITATDASTGSGPYTGSQTYTLTVSAPVISLAPATLPNAMVAASYTASITANGGTSPYTFALATGSSLPSGLTLASDGTISGTPTAGGTFTFTVTATDASTGSGPYSGSQTYTLIVNAPSGITLTPATLPAGTYASVYPGATLAASGGTGPYTFAKTSGSLPPGLTLSGSGVISGTPTQVGDYTFTVTATDASTGSGPYTGSTTYSIHIGTATLTITANDQSMTYGGAVPALTVTYSGFINGDNSSSLTTQPTIATTATSASGVGQYPITVSGAVDPNYTIVYVNGTLTVNPASLLVTAAPVTRYFNTPNPTLTYTFSGFVNGDNASVLTSQPSISTTAVLASPPGQYPITLSGGSAANYTLLYQDAVLTVVQSLNNMITFNPIPVHTYGDPDFPITGVLATSNLPVRFVSQDTSIATVYMAANGTWMIHIVSAGQVTISAFQDGDGQYAPAPEVDQSLQINKASQTITFAALPADAVTGQTLVMSATATSGLPVSFSVSDPTLAAVTGNQLQITGTGTLTVTANQPGNNDYLPAPPVSYTINIFNSAGFRSGIGVFPNPAHGTVHIRFSSDYLVTKYIIFGINGQVVRQETDVASNSNDLPVDVGTLQPGYYLIRVVCIRNNEIVYPVFKVLIY